MPRTTPHASTAGMREGRLNSSPMSELHSARCRGSEPAADERREQRRREAVGLASVLLHLNGAFAQVPASACGGSIIRLRTEVPKKKIYKKSQTCVNYVSFRHGTQQAEKNFTHTHTLSTDGCPRFNALTSLFQLA